ncbi:MAG: SBBP repeat-containing protein [Bacteroidota bacterium]|nr:SBBP repeat-containing protein [Bacteroidota bacterium]
MKNSLLLIASFLINTVSFAGINSGNKPAQHNYSKIISGNYGFIENKGQIIDQNNHLNPAVKYLFNGNGLNIHLLENSFSYDTYSIERKTKTTTEKLSKKFDIPEEEITYHFHRVDITFMGANKNPKLIAEYPSSDYTNYYTTATPEEGVLNVRMFAKVTYKDLYNGIDLEFVLDENNKPKYNFIVHAGADASQIKWTYKGALNAILKDEKIILVLKQGNLEEKIPTSYLLGNSQSVKLNYTVDKENVYGFFVPEYNTIQTLIIDPTPWATYYGGSGEDVASGIVTDANGNAFVSGYTSSSAAIATSGAYQNTLSGTYDAFISEFSGTGIRQWATYFGGTGNDYSYGITSDGSGNLLITGSTSSGSGIATSGSYQSSGNGNNDAFVAKFNASGSRLWGTYYGGSANEQSKGIACDASGNAYITGYTLSLTGIATPGAYRTNLYFYYLITTPHYVKNIFIAKINSTGTALLWGTYYGGHSEDDDKGLAITIDNNNSVLVTGITKADTGITTSGTYQPTISWTNIGNAFIVKFNSSGVRQWGTYYGGPDANTIGNAIITDTSGNIFIAGNGPLTLYGSVGSYQPVNGSGSPTISGADAFVAKFNSSGTARIWGTFYGGSGSEWANGISFDSLGNIIITGQTNSTSAIASTGAYQASLGGTSAYDAFIAKLNPTASARIWGTYFGGSGNDFANAIAVSSNGNIFITGQSASSLGIATSGAHQTTFGTGAYDAFLASLRSNGSLPVKLIYFEAKLLYNKQVLLIWESANEINNNNFTVERSNDLENFEDIGIVKGAVNSANAHYYEFLDQAPFGSAAIPVKAKTLFYRLRQTDFDGTNTLSEIKAVEFGDLTNDQIKLVYDKEQSVLQINSASAQKIVVQIFSLNGSLLTSFTENLKEGYQMIPIQANVSAGFYLLKTQVGDDVQYFKVWMR